jgi:UDP-glucose 4-epimerase
MTSTTPTSTVLVTGGAGFIGSHLTEALLDQGHSVLVLDDLSTGSEAALEAVARRSGFRFVKGSVLDRTLVDDLTRQAGTVVHLADVVGLPSYVERRLHSFTTSIVGAENVLRAAHRHGGRKVLLVGSSEIYGKSLTGPVAEGADRVLGDTGAARWSHCTAKAVDEILATAYHRELGVPTIVVRLFNTAGPRQGAGSGAVVPTFVRQALKGAPLTVHGTGRQRRCFTHVADAVDALLKLLDHPEAVGGVFNIGSDEETGIAALAARVIERAGSNSPIHLVSYPETYGPGHDDIERALPDTTRIRRLTGWRPQRGLVEILDAAIAEARRVCGARDDSAGGVVSAGTAEPDEPVSRGPGESVVRVSARLAGPAGHAEAAGSAQPTGLAGLAVTAGRAGSTEPAGFPELAEAAERAESAGPAEPAEPALV